VIKTTGLLMDPVLQDMASARGEAR